MTRTNRLWIPVLAGLLVAVLLGPGAVAGAEPWATVTQAMMITASAAIPASDDLDYNDMSGVVMQVGAGGGVFTIPLSFPEPVVTIKRITAYLYDNAPSTNVGVSLRRIYPPDGFATVLGEVETSGSSPAQPQAVTTTEISPRRVNTERYGLALRIDMGPGTFFYGVKILYSYDAGA